jgi:HD-GYP domain-containing protein (c-di-GMP phosphodiesterase class II)
VGKTVAYVAADISMESIVRDEAMFFIKLLSLFFGLSLIIMMVIIEVMKHGFVVPVNKMSHAAMKISGATMRTAMAFEMGKLDLSLIQNAVAYVKDLKINTSDEIGQLYDHFNSMTEDTQSFIEQVRDQVLRIQKMQNVMITEFAELVEARDKNTGDHIKKTAEYVEAIAKELRAEGKFKGVLNDGYISKLKQAAPLHDIGKIAVSDLILNKNGKLTDEEFAIMKTHTTAGKEILEKVISTVQGESYLKEARNMAAYHHERWDGRGYPEGLHGEVIPLSARIMAVADVFDALASPRVYKPAFPLEKALAILQEGSGSQFDPKCVEVFMDSLSDVKMVLRKYNGENFAE